MPPFPSWAFTRCRHHGNWGSGHPIAAHYSFFDPERMKGSVGLVGWPIADGHLEPFESWLLLTGWYPRHTERVRGHVQNWMNTSLVHLFPNQRLSSFLTAHRHFIGHEKLDKVISNKRSGGSKGFIRFARISWRFLSLRQPITMVTKYSFAFLQIKSLWSDHYIFILTFVMVALCNRADHNIFIL